MKSAINIAMVYIGLVIGAGEIMYEKLGGYFLGSQGDIWDAQKDMLADGLGAIFTAIIYAIRYRKKDVGKIIGYQKQ